MNSKKFTVKHLLYAGAVVIAHGFLRCCRSVAFSGVFGECGLLPSGAVSVCVEGGK